MRMSEKFLSLARRLYEESPSYCVKAFTSRRFSPEHFQRVIDSLDGDSNGLISIRQVGSSFEGRPLRLVSIGHGTTSVLLWSQMHGDESTATMAISDVVNYFIRTKEEELTQRFLSSLTVHFLPIVNPDGAARFQRRTAQGIDMNRDALALRTPEARILKQAQIDLKPRFGFNLHDQELSTVGSSRELTAIALLAPAFDEGKSDNLTRLDSKRLAATFVSALNHIKQTRITKYDDTFEPRAFGDNFQTWGTSTVLVESGHTLNDPEKESIRILNFVGIVASLYSIATGELEQSKILDYENLPLNGKKAYDCIIRNVLIDHEDGRTTLADLGISYQIDTHTSSTPTLVDLGDIQTLVGLKDIDGRSTKIPQRLLVLGKPFEWERYVRASG